MAQALPRPQKPYTFIPNKAAIGDQVNADFDVLYSLLAGALGDAHIASDAAISGSKIASGSIPSTAFADLSLALSFGVVPVGVVMEWDCDGITAVPVGFEVADGHTCRDASSTRYYNKPVPNRVNLFARGVGYQDVSGNKVTGGEDAHVLTTAEMPPHSHGINLGGYGAGSFNPARLRVDLNSPNNPWLGSTDSTGGGNGHNNIPAYVGTVYIVRVK